MPKNNVRGGVAIGGNSGTPGGGFELSESHIDINGRAHISGGQHLDRRGIADLSTHSLRETLRQESLVKSSLGAYGSSILGARYGVEGGFTIPPDAPGYSTALSGRFAPFHELPPTGGVLTDAQYVNAFEGAYTPMEPSIQREMAEIHANDVPVGSQRWAHMSTKGCSHVPSSRQTEITHLAW